MDMRYAGAARRVIAALLLAVGLGGCVYGPPYAYDSTGTAYYGYPTYVGPPVTLDLGFSFYDGHGYHGHHGYHGGYHGGHHGYHGGHGGHHGRGGWRHHGGGSGHHGGGSRHGGGRH
jgi:hypothetical protein